VELDLTQFRRPGRRPPIDAPAVEPAQSSLF
jgi:hypothetical protein